MNQLQHPLAASIFLTESPDALGAPPRTSQEAIAGDPRDFFLLDEKSPYEIIAEPNLLEHPDWIYPSHLDEARYSLVLVPGECLVTDYLRIFSDTRMFLRISSAVPEISSDGLSCAVHFFDLAKMSKIHIGEFMLPAGPALPTWRVIESDLVWLSGATGQLIVECGPGPEGDAVADWLAVSDLCVAREDTISAHLARTHRDIRMQNEITQLSASYQNELYAKLQREQTNAAQGTARPVRTLDVATNPQLFADDCEIEAVAPSPGESSYDYAKRLLIDNSGSAPPDFANRLQDKVLAQGKIKVLSICSGAARIEAGLAAAVPKGIEWSLLDVNGDLLQVAARQFSSETELDLIKADANNLSPTGEKWDVIICVSALHHLVELEGVTRYISKSLVEGGEFWSIGEAVGRNGNRLWPEAKRAADLIFSKIPAQYRFNAHTKKTDLTIPDTDFSIGCFEGVRSEEIVQLLDRWFERVEFCQVNCFLWRILDLAYCNNYDLAKPDDRQIIADLVKAEISHYRNGGRGTELFAIYTCR